MFPDMSESRALAGHSGYLAAPLDVPEPKAACRAAALGP